MATRRAPDGDGVDPEGGMSNSSVFTTLKDLEKFQIQRISVLNLFVKIIIQEKHAITRVI